MAFGNMMNGMGGIGQRAADLRDSNTPQQLQQGYEKSVKDGKPDIATLLALNDVMKQVKEKEAEMRLAMKPEEPGTVLEQRAKELKDLTVGQNTSEKAEQVGGIAQLQQQKQQQNMQRMAQGTQGPPQGPQMAPQAPPQMAASGGIVMQGAPNLQRMAGGGIVGFNPGGAVMPSAEQLKELGVTEAEWLALTRTEKRKLLSPVAYERGLLDSIKQFLTPKNPVLRDTSDGAIQPTRPQFRTDVDDPGQAPSIGPGNAAPNTQRRPFSGPLGVAPEPVVQPSAQTPAQGRPTLGPFGSFDPSATAAPLGGPGVDVNPNALSGIAQARVPELARAPVPGLGQAKVSEGIPNAFDISATRAGELIGRDQKATQRAANARRLAEANEAAAALRSKNSFADLTSTAGGVGGLANLGRGAANIRRYDADQKKKELLGELGLDDINMKADSADAGKQITAGESAAKAALENSSRKELNRLKEAATASKSMTGARKNLTNIVKAIADLKQKNLEAVDKALANRVDLLKLKQAAADGEPEAIKQLKDIYKKAEEKASVKTKQILIELEALRTNVQNRIAGFGKATLKSKS